MDDETIEILQDFTSESREALENIEPRLIELERNHEAEADSDTVAAAFRFFHSMKGTASFLEFHHVVNLTHIAESLLDLVRKGATPLMREHIDVLCETLDLVRKMLDSIDEEYTDNAHEDASAQLVVRLEGLVHAVKNGDVVETEGNVTEGIAEADAEIPALHASASQTMPAVSPHDFSEREVPAVHPEADDEMAELLASMMTPEMLGKFQAETEEHIEAAEDALMRLDVSAIDNHLVESAFRALHTIKGNASLFGFEHLAHIAHSFENTLDDVRSGEVVLHKELVNTLLGGVDAIRIELASVCGSNAPDEQALKIHPEPSDGRTGGVPSNKPGSSGAAVKAPAVTTHRGSSIRVDTEKLDELMNLVGELIIAETTVTHNPDLEGHHFQAFQKAAMQLNRLTRRLQQVTMSVRMVPVVSTFRKMLRLVRDVSSKQSKSVNLIVEGEQTEVDKTVIEMISDPLVHMIRNAVDHGIEPPAERLAAGKPAQGTIRLSAAHEGQEVWITIRDDGRGLNRKRIVEKAIEKGLLTPEDEPSDAEVFKLIFAPGFSTAAQVTDLSGRGVGMDVALRNIEAMNGRVDIQSVEGKGSTFVLRIPLTLAIIEGMLVRVGDSAYTLPLLSIREHVRAKKDEITTLPDGTELFRLRDTLYPIYHLHDMHGIARGATVEEGILILVTEGDHTVCLLVDQVVGQRQTVIKPVPEYLRGVKGISGCSILHNGEISLILDVEGLVRRVAKAA